MGRNRWWCNHHHHHAGSKTLLPAVFTDTVAAAELVAATVGSIDDLDHLAVVVESLMPPAVGAASRRTLRGIPIKEDPVHLMSQLAFDLDDVAPKPPPPADRPPDDLPDRDREAAVAQVGVPDRQVPRRGGVGR